MGASRTRFWVGAVTVTAFLLLLVVLSSRVVLFFPGLLVGVGAYLVARRYRPTPLRHRVTLPRVCASLLAVGSAFGVLLYFVPTYELGHAWNLLSLLAGLALSIALARVGDESPPAGLAAVGAVLVGMTFVSGGIATDAVAPCPKLRDWSGPQNVLYTLFGVDPLAYEFERVDWGQFEFYWDDGCHPRSQSLFAPALGILNFAGAGVSKARRDPPGGDAD
jgi:hypothetical protein